ncbi:MAG: flagellar hook-length control protein FliK [Myxococcota bacterium]|nr:flagellar hook-length control protein FliK [Myxococcota bacterium]
MDVNSSPGVVAFPRPDGNGVERPNGLMFDSFLSIASGLGAIEQPDHDESQHQRGQDDGDLDAKSSVENRKARQDDDSDRDRSDDRHLSRRMAGGNQLRTLIDRTDTQTVADHETMSDKTGVDRGKESIDGNGGSAETKVDLSEETQSKDDHESSDTAIAVDVDVKAYTKAVDLSKQSDEGFESMPIAAKDFETIKTQRSNDAGQDAVGETVEGEDVSELLESKRALHRLLEQELNGRRSAESKTKPEQSIETKTNSDVLLMGDDDGVDKGRFLDRELVRRAQSQMDKMNGQSDLKSSHGQEQKEVGGKEEWNRLLQFSASNVRQGEQKTVTDGQAMKLLTSAGRGTESDATAPKLSPTATAAAGRTPTKTSVASSKANVQNASLTRNLPDGVDDLSILRQISDGLKLKSGRLQRAQIRLNPEELGTVDIKMQMKGDSVRISVSTEHQSVAEILANNLEQLKREILAQGLHIEHVEVNGQLADDGTGQGSDTTEQDDLQEFEQVENHDEAETRTHDGFLNVKA